MKLTHFSEGDSVKTVLYQFGDNHVPHDTGNVHGTYLRHEI